eukprot:2313096-Amphidinium_carterae.1
MLKRAPQLGLLAFENKTTKLFGQRISSASGGVGGQILSVAALDRSDLLVCSLIPLGKLVWSRKQFPLRFRFLPPLVGFWFGLLLPAHPPGDLGVVVSSGARRWGDCPPVQLSSVKNWEHSSMA